MKRFLFLTVGLLFFSQTAFGQLHGSHTAVPEPSYGPELDIQGYADVLFTNEHGANTGDKSPSTFSLGQFELFIASQLSQNVSFLSEVVIEQYYYSSYENEGDISLERFQITYALTDLVHISAGRMHTALGYWNTSYHHSSFFYTTAFRPLLYRWEGNNGILPVHQVGLQLFGSKEFTSFDFGYNFGITNGRGRTPMEVVSVQDHNGAKAVNLLLEVAPHFAPGLKLGGSAYMDTIPPDSDFPERDGEIDELIGTGFLTYLAGPVELLAEAAHIRHDDAVSGETYTTFGAYLQGGYQIGAWKPYYRYDLIDFSGEDPFYTVEYDPGPVDIQKHTVGIRWDLFTWNAIKAEYSYTDRDDAERRQTFTIQSSFVF